MARDDLEGWSIGAGRGAEACFGGGLGFWVEFGGFFLADFPDEKVPPADLAAVSLEHDGAFGWQGLGAIPVVFHGGTVDDQLVIQPDPCATSDLANSELVPFTEGLVGDGGGIASGSVRGIVEQAAGTEMGFSVGFFGVKGLCFVPDLDLRGASEIDATVCAGDGFVFDEKLDIAEFFVGRGVGASADIDEFAVLNVPMRGEFGALLLVVGLFLVANQFGRGVGVQAVPTGEIFTIEDGPETFGRSGVGRGEASEEEG